MPERLFHRLVVVGLMLGSGGCATSFDTIDRSATAFAQRIEDDERCYSRPGPNGEVTIGCAVPVHTRETSTTTTTTTDAEGRVTTTTTRKVNGLTVPDRR